MRSQVARRVDEIKNLPAEALAFSNLLGYAAYMNPDYEVARHNYLIAKALMAVEAGEITRLMINMPPRHGKPVSVDEMVLMADGQRIRLGDVKVDDMVIAHSGKPRRVLAIYDQGEIPVVEIITECGRRQLAALDHPYLTTRGWIDAGNLLPGDVLAVSHAPQCASAQNKSDAEYAFAGYMIGDGCCKNNASFSNGDEEIIYNFRSACSQLGFKIEREIKKPNHVELFPLGCRDWLRENNMWGKTSHEKRVPRFVFESSNDKIALFIASYFECDGSVNKRGDKRKDCCVEIYSVNKGLLEDIRHLLLRFSIKSRIAVKNGTYKTMVHKSYRLSVTGIDNVAKFYESIPIVGPKKKTLDAWSPVRSQFGENKFLTDVVISNHPAGNHECRCLFVDEDHTFTVDDVVVHNTMLTSEFFPSWYIGRNPDKQVIAATYSFDRATDVGRKVRDYMADPLYTEIFPDARLCADSKSANKLGTTAGGNYFSVGIGGATVGRGAHLFLIDDPVKSREDADSEVTQRKIRNWYRSVAYTRLMPGKSAIVIIMTRWHFYDLSGWLLDEGKDDWAVLELPAIATNHETLTGRQPGDALWPTRYPLPKLRQIKENIGSREWNSQYQQRPIPEEGGHVKLSWFQRYNWRDLKIIESATAARATRSKAERDLIKRFAGDTNEERRFVQVACSWDTAFKESELSDPSALTVWGITNDNVYYLLFVLNQHMTFPELVRSVVKMHERQVRRFSISASQVPVLIEDKASGQSLIQILKRETRIPIIPITPDHSKEIRFNEVAPIIESGRVFLPENASWLVDFETQILQFPLSKGKDMADSMSQFLRWTHKPKFKKRGVKFWK